MRIRGLRIILAVALAVPAAGTGAADTAGDFTFRRIGPPATGAPRLINIQVEPAAPVERVLSNVPDLPPESQPALQSALPRAATPSDGAAAWFWAELSPALAAAAAGRMSRAMQVVNGNATVLPPELDRLSELAGRYGPQILTATAGTQVSPALVLAVMSVESGGRPQARSHAGAVGLMQLMPATARRFGVRDRTDPGQNIAGGVGYLSFLINEFAGDPLLTLAAYNAGEGAVRKSGGVPNYAETREYVPKVIAAWNRARLLCLTPPMRATDGCLFNGLRVAGQ